MKYVILFVAFLTLHLHARAQGGTWTWVKGDSTQSGLGHRGTKGVSNAADYPSARYQSAQWTDLNGNFWIYGGDLSLSVVYNDLWKYDPANNIWTWVNGSSAVNQSPVYGTLGIPGPNNTPGARTFAAATWTDKQGHLWMYGGSGYSSSSLGDLWMYDILSNQWTWMKGADTSYPIPNYGTLHVEDPSNNRGMRYESNTAWVRSDGTLWAFGGTALYPGRSVNRNDMWKFDISTNNWTWMSGDSAINSSYSFGTKNIEASTNLPKARSSYCHWQDDNDNFYILGGSGVFGHANDIWKYNTSNDRWTWIGGDTMGSSQDLGKYTQQCLPGDSASYSARYENKSVQSSICSSNFWVFGGAIGYNTVHNDLWVFNVQTLKWTWVSGSDTLDSYGSYGTINVGNPANVPQARSGECLWIDQVGTLWTWGGFGVSYNFSHGTLNDMWKFVPDTSCVHLSPSVLVPTITRTGTLLTSSPAAHYQWQYNGTDISSDTLSHITMSENGTYTVIVTNASGCSNSSSITVTNVGINTLDGTKEISIYPNPATQSCTIFISNYAGENYTAKLTDIAGKEISNNIAFAASSFTFPVSQYSKGVYLLHITNSKNDRVIKKLLVE